MENNIELYSNKYNENKDIERLKSLSINLEKLYYLNLNKLNEIKEVYLSSDYMLNEDVSSYNAKYFNYEQQLLSLKSKIWRNALSESFLDKYFTEEQKSIVVSKINIYYDSNRANQLRETLEPTSQNIFNCLEFIIMSKDNFVVKNLFEFIRDNSFRVLRKHNKPLEFTNFLVFDLITDYRIESYSRSKTFSLHKALCAFFDIDYSKYESIANICNDLHLDYKFNKYKTKEDNERLKELAKEKRKLEYDYLLGMKLKFYKDTFRIYFNEDTKNKLNKEIIEIYKSSLIN